MPKLLCRCGFTINLSDVPLTTVTEYKCITQSQIDVVARRIGTAIGERVEGPADLTERIGDALTFGLTEHGSEIYVCPNCGRLIVFREGSDQAEFFLAEPPKSQGANTG